MNIENFEKCCESIQKALDYGKNSHTLDDVRQSIAKGEMFFHTLGNSFIITEVHVFPQYYNLHGFLAGGHTEEIKELMPILEDKAREVGCKYTTLTGRKGWQREFKDVGYNPTFFTLDKEL